jgi:putative oxidoreductase
MVMPYLDKYRDTGLLILRIGIGCMFIYHGFPKIFGGPQMWEKVGLAAMPGLGIRFAPEFWGFMAGLSEMGGGILIILGLFFRLACIFPLLVMAVATHMQLTTNGMLAASQPIEDGILFLSLIFIGPGKYSLDAKLPCGCCAKR